MHQVYTRRKQMRLFDLFVVIGARLCLVFGDGTAGGRGPAADAVL